MLREKIDANERIRGTQTALRLDDGTPLPFLCECVDVACRTVIRLTAAEYAEVRARADRWVVAEGHPFDGRAVKTGNGYVVAEL